MSERVLPGLFDQGAPKPPAELDVTEARRRRDRALIRVTDPAFTEAALEAVRQAALAHPRFIVDVVWTFLAGRPVEARAMGPVMVRAHKLGYIEPTGDFLTSAQIKGHATPRRVWRSLLYR